MKADWRVLMFSFTTLLQANCLDLPNPAGLYPLDGTRKASDISCHSNPEGKLHGVKLSKGPYGVPSSAYMFSSSSSSYIKIPGSSYTDAQYSITLLASIYHSGFAGPIVDYAGDGLGVNLWMTGQDTLNGRFITRDGTNNVFLISSNQVALRFSWHDVGLTYNYVTGTAELYIDGNRVRRLYLGRFELKTKGSIRLGAVKHDDRYFKGKISCLQIYNKALTEMEIRKVRMRCSMKEPVNCSTTDSPPRLERHMTSSSGTFSSPGYPRGYPADSNCIWTIKVPAGKKLVVVFSNLDLEQDSDCPDYVKVLDGLTSWSPELRKFCYTTVGKNNRVTSSANSVRVEFHSNSVVSGEGFTATYTSQDIESADQDFALDLSIHYTGIVIGVACAALFTVLSIIAVSHSRRRRRRRRSSTFSDRRSSDCPSDDDVIRQGAPPSYDIVMRCPDLYPPSPQMSPASSILSTPAVQPRFKVPPKIVSPLASRATSPVLSTNSPWHSGNISRNTSGNLSPGYLSPGNISDDEDPPPYPGIVVIRGDTVLGPHQELSRDREPEFGRHSTPSLHWSNSPGRGYLRTRSSDLSADRNRRQHELSNEPARRSAGENVSSISSPGLAHRSRDSQLRQRTGTNENVAPPELENSGNDSTDMRGTANVMLDQPSRVRDDHLKADCGPRCLVGNEVGDTAHACNSGVTSHNGVINRSEGVLLVVPLDNSDSREYLETNHNRTTQGSREDVV